MRPADFSENDGIADDDESVDACSRDGDDAEDDAEDDADDQARLPATSIEGTSEALPWHRGPPVLKTARDIDMWDNVIIRRSTGRVTVLCGRGALRRIERARAREGEGRRVASRRVAYQMDGRDDLQ